MRISKSIRSPTNCQLSYLTFFPHFSSNIINLNGLSAVNISLSSTIGLYHFFRLTYITVLQPCHLHSTSRNSVLLLGGSWRLKGDDGKGQRTRRSTNRLQIFIHPFARCRLNPRACSIFSWSYSKAVSARNWRLSISSLSPWISA